MVMIGSVQLVSLFRAAVQNMEAPIMTSALVDGIYISEIDALAALQNSTYKATLEVLTGINALAAMQNSAYKVTLEVLTGWLMGYDMVL